MNTKNKLPLIALLGILASAIANADTLIVDSLEDNPDADPNDGLCADSFGNCTLSAAISESFNRSLENPAGDYVIDLSGLTGTIRSESSGSFSSYSFGIPVTVIGSESVTIESTAPNGGVLGVFSDNVKFQSLNLRNFGITVFGYDDFLLENSVVEGGFVFVFNGSARPVIRGNRFFKAPLGQYPYYMRLESVADSVTVNDNVFGVRRDGAQDGAVVDYAFLITLEVRPTIVEIARNEIQVIGSGIAAFDLSEVNLTDNSVIVDGRASSLFGVSGINGTRLQNVSITGNTTERVGLPAVVESPFLAGVSVRDSALVRIDNHRSFGPFSSGISATEGSDAVITGSDVRDATSSGISIDDSSFVQIYRTTTSSNSGLGIDVGQVGVQPNGPDAFTDFPDIGDASAGLQLAVAGTQTGFPGETITLEFFESATCDPSGHGEGERYLGTTNTVIDALGSGQFNALIDVLATPGAVLTATATGDLGTSEFSACTVLTDSRPPANDINFVRLNAWVLNTGSNKPLAGFFPATDVQDPDRIDLDSLLLGNAIVLRSKRVDVDDDGDRDLVVYFRGSETGASCGTADLTLTGQADGVDFTHTEPVVLKPCQN